MKWKFEMKTIWGWDEDEMAMRWNEGPVKVKAEMIWHAMNFGSDNVKLRRRWKIRLYIHIYIYIHITRKWDSYEIRLTPDKMIWTLNEIKMKRRRYDGMRLRWEQNEMRGRKGEYDNGMRPVAPFTKLFNLVITSNIMCGMKLLIHS